MKKRIFAIITSALMIFALCCPVLAEGIPGAVNRAADSVIRLTVKTSFGTEKTTGIAIGKGSKAKYILTGLRAVEAGEILAGTSDEQNIPASIIASDSQSNLAVLELSEEIEDAKPVKFTKKELDGEEEIYAVGYYAKEDESNITAGNVVSRNNYSADGISAEIYRVTAPVTERNSGGMLSDKHGHAAGICYYDGNTDADKAVTSSEIFTMLDENGIEYKKATILYQAAAAALILAALIAAALLIMSAVRKNRLSSPRIVGVSGDFAGQEIPVSTENLSIGRDAKICQVVVLGDSKVSRCHCTVRYDKMKGMFILTDLSSTHGTYADGQKLEPNVPKYISPGTVFNVGTGNTSFRASEGGASS